MSLHTYLDLTFYLRAGSRDVALSSHGALQAQRLGSHLRARSDEIGPISRIFTSDMRRARKTADAIAIAQQTRPLIASVSDLRERDFRSREGERFQKKSSVTGPSTPHTTSNFPPESYVEMKVRARKFIDQKLGPALSTLTERSYPISTIVVVSHGIFLGILMATLQTKFETFAQQLESFPALSNTGYIDVVVARNIDILHGITVRLSRCPLTAFEAKAKSLTLSVLSCNRTDHLSGLKRTRGGIGSAQHDESQRSIHAFFGPSNKKRKMSIETK